MSGLRSFSLAAGAQPDRNDPCPCGSGLKYKKCCAIRPQSVQPTQPRPALGALTALGREVTSIEMVNRVTREAAPRPAAPVQVAKPAAATAPPSRELARYLREVVRLRSAGRADEAIPLLRRMVQLAPDNAKAWHYLGSFLLDCGEISGAV